MQGGKKPTKAQQDWQDWQREQGCTSCGTSNPAIHHCVGSTAKHNKVSVGQWFTIPLCYECHQGEQGIHLGMGIFPFDDRKHNEKLLFKKSNNDYFAQYSIWPIPLDVYHAIMDYHK